MGFEVTYIDIDGMDESVIVHHPKVTFELGELNSDYTYTNTLKARYLSLIFDAFVSQASGDENIAWGVLNKSIIRTTKE